MSVQGSKRVWKYNKIKMSALAFLLQSTTIDGYAL